MENILSKQEQENLSMLLETHTQAKHFRTLSEELDTYRSKNQIISKMLEMLKNEEISFNEFKSWLALHQLDGNNYFFVFELSDHKFSKEYFDRLMPRVESNTKNILEYNGENLSGTLLVNAFHATGANRVILTYISPAKVLRKVQTANAGLQDEIKKQIYYANVIVDYGYNIVIISINPTTRLISVDNVDKTRNFESIANYYLNRIKQTVGDFHIRVPQWISEALSRFAEEATYHNNPKIEEQLTQANPIIENMVNDLLDRFELSDQALNLYVAEEFQRAFENALVDKYGVAEENKNEYKVFEQKGDKVNSYVHVGYKSEVSSLQTGDLAKVAKATRNNSDITLLGIEHTVEKERYRFCVDSGTDYFLIKNKSIKFTKEEVIYNVIKRLEFYREQIRRESSDFCK